MAEARARRPIRVLPETVANQIAAGEVVERPASVVKELVENALDAGARRIDVSVEGGGAKAIVVEDDGCGMDPDDARACLERQATSKIETSEDIERIATFGFRGEAIPSIASVSRFSILTRPAEALSGTEVVVTGGALEHVGPAGHPAGTTVAVRDLFFNVPARRKFLRAAATELARIRQTLTAIAFAHPGIAFRLQADGRDLFRLPAGDTLDDRLRALLGEETAEAMLPVDHAAGGLRVHGRISRPDFVRGGAPEQYFFVNRRPATAPQLQYALREAWPQRDNRPVALLFIDLPPEAVDVNVHPAKREVRFRHGNLVVDALAAALGQALAATAAPAPRVPPAPAPAAPGALQPAAPLSPVGALPTPPAPLPRQDALPFRPAAPRPVTPPPPSPGVEAPPAGTPLPWAWARIADVLEPGYWLVVTDQGYVTVDAKAALERILYERLAESGAAPAAQPLLLPETLELPPADAERLARFLPDLEACGFELASLGDTAFLVNALPADLAHLPPKPLLAGLAAELADADARRGLDRWKRELVARAAAKAASGAFRVATPEAAEKLMAQLARCAMPYTTPRGRPVMILTSYRELARRFRRE